MSSWQQGCKAAAYKALLCVVVAQIHADCRDDDADENVVIRAHFLPPFTGMERPWNHAPIKTVIPPVMHPACQSFGRKKAVAISATPSMANTFDQYLNISMTQITTLFTFFKPCRFTRSCGEPHSPRLCEGHRLMARGRRRLRRDVGGSGGRGHKSANSGG